MCKEDLEGDVAPAPAEGGAEQDVSELTEEEQLCLVDDAYQQLDEFLGEERSAGQQETHLHGDVLDGLIFSFKKLTLVQKGSVPTRYVDEVDVTQEDGGDDED